MTSRHDFFATHAAEEVLDVAERLEHALEEVAQIAADMEIPEHISDCLGAVKYWAATHKAAARKEFFGE